MNKDVPRKQILKVEFLVRKAEKNLDLIKSSQVRGCH